MPRMALVSASAVLAYLLVGHPQDVVLRDDSATPEAADRVNYTAAHTDRSLVITTDAGSMSVDGNAFTITDSHGTILAGTELSFRVDDYIFPVTAEITERTATLTPRFDVEHAVYEPVALPFQDQAQWRSEYEREQAAWNRMTSTMRMGSTIAAIVAGTGGAAIGCVLGGIAGATIASATIIGLFGAFLPAALIGCLGGILALGALGTVAGQIFVAAPIAVMAAVQYFTTINEPMPSRPPVGQPPSAGQPPVS